MFILIRRCKKVDMQTCWSGCWSDLTCSFISKQCGPLPVVVLAITSSALWIASRLEIPALHPSASSCRIGMSGRDARTPAGKVYPSEIPSQMRSTLIPPPLPIHIHPLLHTYIHTYIHGFSLASFAIPFLAIDLLVALRLAYMV